MKFINRAQNLIDDDPQKLEIAVSELQSRGIDRAEPQLDRA